MVDMARSVGLPVAQKEIAGRLESGTQTGEHEKDESKWRAKKRRQSPERSCLPTAATLPSALNGDFGTSPLTTVKRVDSLSLTDECGKE